MSLKSLIWIVPAALTVCWVATMTRDANVEADKQTAFMMKACVDAGGEWSIPWGRPSCIRPKTAQ